MDEKKEKKVAVWICKGCEIGEALDIEAIEKVVISECKVELCRTHSFLCGDEGVALIQKDVQEGVNTLVIAACSPRCNADTFTFDGCFTDRVNLREHVVWSHSPNDEDTQMLAEDYLRIGIARA